MEVFISLTSHNPYQILKSRKRRRGYLPYNLFKTFFTHLLTTDCQITFWPKEIERQKRLDELIIDLPSRREILT